MKDIQEAEEFYEEFLEICDADRPVRIAAVRRDGDGGSRPFSV